MYKMLDRSPTSVQTLTRARKIGLEGGLRYVYTGNVPGMRGKTLTATGAGSFWSTAWVSRFESIRLSKPDAIIAERRLMGGSLRAKS